jgi:hypothetical protein
MSDAERYITYYQQQSLGVGGGSKYSRTQKGLGIGSFLGNLFRKIAPYVVRGAKSLGSELLSTGVNVLKDRMNNKDMKESLDTHFGNAGKNLASNASNSLQSMLGMGYKRRRAPVKRQSRPVKRRRKTVKKKSSKTKKAKRASNKSNKRKRDIFGF